MFFLSFFVQYFGVFGSIRVKGNKKRCASSKIHVDMKKRKEPAEIQDVESVLLNRRDGLWEKQIGSIALNKSPICLPRIR